MIKSIRGLLSVVLATILAMALAPQMAFAEPVGAFNVEGGTPGTDYSYSGGVLTVLTSVPLTISNTDPNTATTDRIVVSSGVSADITLGGVNIDVRSISSTCALNLDTAGASIITLASGNANTLRSGYDRPGIYVPNGNKLTIDGEGTLNTYGGASWPGIGRTGSGNIEINGGTINAIGGSNASGIGGSWGFPGGIITINGGTVNATGGSRGAGIGGGWTQAGGTIIVKGGTVNATGGSDAAGIGGGSGGGSGTFLMDGNAVVVASSVSDSSAKTNGILFVGNTGTVYGSVSLAEDLEVPAGKTLTIAAGRTLTITEDATLTNNGTIFVTENGIINNNGTIAGNKPNREKPAAPTENVVSSDSITINGTSAAMQYACITGESPGDSDWQSCTASTTVISGLSRNTAYKIFLRYPETDMYNVSEASDALAIATEKETGVFVPISEIDITYTPALTLSDLSLPEGYAWNMPDTALNAGDNQSFDATYIDPSGDYKAADGTITVNVAKADQTLTAADINKIIGDGDIVLTDHATSTAGAFGGAITYVVTDAGTTGAAIDSSTLSYTAAGTATITATTAGSANYNGASITFDLTVTAISYPTLEHFGTWTLGESGTVSGRVDASHERFVRLILDGVEISPEHYTMGGGSTTITLIDDHLNTHEAGTYIYRVEFTDGYADLELMVAEAATEGGTENIIPETGDRGGIVSLVFPAIVAAAGLILLLRGYRSRRYVAPRRF